MGSQDFYDLIPELEEWGNLNGHPFEPESWLCGTGSFSQAIAYGRLFWPEIHVFEDCVFVGNPPPKELYDDWFRATDGDKAEIEKVVNHIHLEDLFAEDPGSKAQYEHLGELIRSMWGAKAQSEFPHRQIVAEFYRGTIDASRDYQVTLFQVP